MKTKNELLQVIAEQEQHIEALKNKCQEWDDKNWSQGIKIIEFINREKYYCETIEEQKNTIKELEEIICELKSGRCAGKTITTKALNYDRLLKSYKELPKKICDEILASAYSLSADLGWFSKLLNSVNDIQAKYEKEN